jgi:hypothetical protein
VRFRPDAESGGTIAEGAILVDPEAADYTEQQFSASLDNAPIRPARARFEVDAKEAQGSTSEEQSERVAEAGVDLVEETTLPPEDRRSSPDSVQPVSPATVLPRTDAEAVSNGECESVGLAPERALTSQPYSTGDDSFWRNEVAARLSYYRARRKQRPPKYPSLQLKFDPVERKAEFRPDPQERTREAVALATAEPNWQARTTELQTEPVPAEALEVPAESARIIEFPRSYAMVFPPLSTGDELADPVLDRPRIVEVPDVDMPAPALGGIILEPEEQEPERRPGFEIPLQSAAKTRRMVASACDASIVLGAGLVFGYIFFKITGTVPPLATVGSAGCFLLVLFWTTYQYLLLTYAGTTPGLRLARLQLRYFDGRPVERRMRGWRVIASVLSGLSLGLGYAWCFLDEDALCWHDRITRTHLEPL